MNTLRSLGIAVVSAAVALPATASERPAVAAAGSRIRVAVEGGIDGNRLRAWQEGRLVRLDGDSLVIEDSSGTVTSVPRGRILRLQQSLGPRSRVRGALIGAGIAAVVGVAATYAFSPRKRDDPTEHDFATDLGLYVYTPLAMAAASGVGALVRPGERWRNVSHERVSVRFEPGEQRAVLRLAFSF